jgi:O-antigen ligase
LTVPFLIGIWSTDSITAIVTVLGGATAALLTSYIARRSVAVAAALALTGFLLLGLTFVPSDITSSSGRIAKSFGGPGAFSGSLGRTDQSLTPRLERIQETFRYFGSDIIVGIGPSATSATLDAARAPIRGELHNDYAAGFIERGVVGGLGVLGLFGAAFWWSTRTGTDASLRRAGWRPAALTGATLVVLMAGFSLETLHFRHVWAVFALTIALALGTGEGTPQNVSGPAPEIDAGPEPPLRRR